MNTPTEVKAYSRQAIELLSLKLQTLPLKLDKEGKPKKPALSTWKPIELKGATEEQIKKNFDNTITVSYIDKEEQEQIVREPGDIVGIGIVCGAISGGLEVIDIDTKHDTTGTLWEDFSSLIKEHLPEIYEKLVIVRTISGGLHLYYRVATVKGNLKLATSKSKETLIETRGQGGYIVAPETPGYSFIQGDFTTIPNITEIDRDILFNLAEDFSEVKTDNEKELFNNTTYFKNTTGKRPGDLYDDTGDIVQEFLNYSWRVVRETADRVYLQRSGATSEQSGNFHKIKRTVRIFSSSTDFRTDKAYSPFQAYVILNYGQLTTDNYRAAARQLSGNTYTPPRQDSFTSKSLTITNVCFAVTPGDTITAENLCVTKDFNGYNVVLQQPYNYREALQFIKFALKHTEIESQRQQDFSIDIHKDNGGNQRQDYLSFIPTALIEVYRDTLDLFPSTFFSELLELLECLRQPYRDIVKKRVLNLDEIKELGLTAKGLEDELNNYIELRQQEKQQQQVEELLQTAKTIHEIKEGLYKIETDTNSGYSSLLTPFVEETAIEELRELGQAIKTGYTINKKELLLPPGAITIVAAATGHGKSKTLINIMLNQVLEYPEKNFYYLCYEESSSAILTAFLNAYCDIKLHHTDTREAIKEYLRTGKTDCFGLTNKTLIEDFFKKKQEFFKIVKSGRLNIQHINYKEEELCNAIRYINDYGTPGAIVIDYIQLINMVAKEKKLFGTRQEELKEICQRINTVAKETRLPILVAAQFNRDVKKLTDMHETALREAADLEQIANTIIGVWDNKKNTGKLTDNDKKAIIYLLGCETEDKIIQDSLFVQILKSRYLRAGETATWTYNWLTNKINTF